jgi:hypothetical protein
MPIMDERERRLECERRAAECLQRLSHTMDSEARMFLRDQARAWLRQARPEG